MKLYLFSKTMTFFIISKAIRDIGIIITASDRSN